MMYKKDGCNLVKELSLLGSQHIQDLEPMISNSSTLVEWLDWKSMISLKCITRYIRVFDEKRIYEIDLLNYYVNKIENGVTTHNHRLTDFEISYVSGEIFKFLKENKPNESVS